MSVRFRNACLKTDDIHDITNARKAGVHSFSVVTKTPDAFQNETDTEVFFHVDSSVDLAKAGNIYIEEPGLDEELLDAVIAHVLGGKNIRVMVRTMSDLYEAGRIESRYKLSPIMLLHKTGLLQSAIIAGGVHLDKDDIDLMAQCRTPLIVLPISDMLSGNGVAPVFAAKSKLAMSIGTFDCRFNPSGSILREAFALQLAVSAQMERECALTMDELLSFSGTGSPQAFARLLYA